MCALLIGYAFLFEGIHRQMVFMQLEGETPSPSPQLLTFVPEPDAL